MEVKDVRREQEGEGDEMKGVKSGDG